MDLLEILLVAVRRWYVSAPGVLLTIGAALTIGTVMPLEYKTSASILLVPPTVRAAEPPPGRTPTPSNPWLRVGETGMAQAVQITVSTPKVRQSVDDAGGSPDYEVGHVIRSAILTIDVAASSPAQATRTIELVSLLISDEVTDRQRQYEPAPGEAIGTQVLDPGTGVVPSRFHILRAQLIVGAIGLVLSFGAAFAYNALARRRRSPVGHPTSLRPRGVGDVGIARVAAPAAADTRPSDHDR